MFFVVGNDGVEYGPADAAAVGAWLREGRATLRTRARRADSAEWKMLGDFPEFAAQATPPPLPASARKDPVRIDAGAYAAKIIARAKPLDVTGCIARGWAFYKSDFGPILGVTLLTLLVSGAVPVVGVGFGVAGLYYYYLGKMRGERRQFADVFVGLQRMTVPLLLASVVVFAISLACVLPTYAFMLIGVLMQSVEGLALAGAGVAAACAASLYVSVVLLFVFPLIIDKNLDWRDALAVSRKVVHSQFWRFLGMMVLLWLISCLGLLVFVVGLYLLAPLSLCACAQAYEDVFGGNAE